MRELTFGYVELPHIEIKNPQLWWPLGYGDQPLYDVTLEIFKDGIPVAKKSVKHGIRTIELERDQYKSAGQTGKIHVPGQRGTDFQYADATGSGEIFSTVSTSRRSRRR